MRMPRLVIPDSRLVRAVLCVARSGSRTRNPAVVVPCGKCRQKIMEFSVPDSTFVLAGDVMGLEPVTIGALLPAAFSLGG